MSSGHIDEIIQTILEDKDNVGVIVDFNGKQRPAVAFIEGARRNSLVFYDEGVPYRITGTAWMTRTNDDIPVVGFTGEYYRARIVPETSVEALRSYFAQYGNAELDIHMP